MSKRPIAMTAASSPSGWIFHSPHPEISHLSLSSLYLRESLKFRRRRRAQRLLLLPKCSSSLNEDSPVVEEIMKKGTEMAKVEIDSDLSSVAVLDTVKMLTRRRRGRAIALWKRIFFASKKVRSIILLNILTLIYASDIPVLKEVEQIMDPAISHTWFGALLSLIGVGILEYGGFPPCVGDILNIMGAAFFGVHIFRTEQISRSTKKEEFLALLGYQVSVVALSSAVWFICKDMFSELLQLNVGSEPESESWVRSAWWDWMVSFPWIPAIYTGVFSTGLCLLAEAGQVMTA